MFGLHMGRMGARSGGSTLAAKVAALFRSGEQGAWYDPSDLSTLYQDAAGTSPVTAVGQPVGRMLDKSGRGNTATQPIAINRPVLSARVNLLTKTEDFTDVSWTKAGVTPTLNYGIAPDGTQTSARIQFSAAGQLITQGAAIASSVYSSRVWLKGTAGETVQVATGGPDVLHTLTGVWQEATALAKAAINTQFNINTYGGATARNIEVWHPQMEAGSAVTSYQRVNTSADYNAVGFPHYLAFNGTNSWMQTAAIDFTATDKMTVVAGLRKLSDSGNGTLVELSTGDSNSGMFFIRAPSGGAANIQYLGRGTTAATYTPTVAANMAAVISVQQELSAPSLLGRLNGANPTAAVSATGGGSYGNYPFYIGARAGSSLFFNGNLYGLIVRGALSSDPQIASAEAFMNSKTGAY